MKRDIIVVICRGVFVLAGITLPLPLTLHAQRYTASGKSTGRLHVSRADPLPSGACSSVDLKTTPWTKYEFF